MFNRRSILIITLLLFFNTLPTFGMIHPQWDDEDNDFWRHVVLYFDRNNSNNLRLTSQNMSKSVDRLKGQQFLRARDVYMAIHGTTSNQDDMTPILTALQPYSQHFPLDSYDEKQIQKLFRYSEFLPLTQLWEKVGDNTVLQDILRIAARHCAVTVKLNNQTATFDYKARSFLNFKLDSDGENNVIYSCVQYIWTKGADYIRSALSYKEENPKVHPMITTVSFVDVTEANTSIVFNVLENTQPITIQFPEAGDMGFEALSNLYQHYPTLKEIGYSTSTPNDVRLKLSACFPHLETLSLDMDDPITMEAIKSFVSISHPHIQEIDFPYLTPHDVRLSMANACPQLQTLELTDRESPITEEILKPFLDTSHPNLEHITTYQKLSDEIEAQIKNVCPNFKGIIHDWY